MFKKVVLFILALLFLGCSCAQERQAHKIMAARHFPYLIGCYKNDPEKSALLKEVLIKSVEEWNKLILSK